MHYMRYYSRLVVLEEQGPV